MPIEAAVEIQDISNSRDVNEFMHIAPLNTFS